MTQSNSAVQIKVTWGDNTLFVTELNPPRNFSIGEDGEFVVGGEQLGVPRFDLIQVNGDQVVVAGPRGAMVETKNGAESASSSALLSHGQSAVVRHGELKFEVSVGAPEARVARAIVDEDMGSRASYFGASLLSVGGLLGAMAFLVPPFGITEGETIDAERLVAMQAYLDASAEKEKERSLHSANETGSDASEPGAQAEGPSGTAGKPEAANNHSKLAVKGPKTNQQPELSKLEQARTFGMIGLLSGGVSDLDAATAPWGRDDALGNDDLSAMGNLWGDEIGESTGTGGLGLLGLSDGGGGKYRGIGLGRVSTIGLQGQCDSSETCGFDRGVSGGKHAVRVPQARPDGKVNVSGRIPPEVVQRRVRQNFGRFRACYEQGLLRNPNLQGRVAVRFMISRDGTVSNAANGGSSMPDSAVASCVVSAFYGISFPKPENGSVTVSYPIMFSPG